VRRSKLGLRFSPEEREALARFMAATIGATGDGCARVRPTIRRYVIG